MRSLRRVFALILACVPLSAEAVVRLDHKKLSVSYLYFRRPNASEPVRYFRQPNATEPPELRSIATFSVDYNTYEIFEVALEKFDRFLEKVRTIGFQHQDESRLDTLSLYGGTINTRSPVPIDPARSPQANYLPGQYGVYVMNLVGAHKNEWGQTLYGLGVIHCQQIYPYTGWIVGATPEIAERVNDLPWVQFMEPYHPFLKPRPDPTSPTLLTLTVEFGRLPGKESAQERVRALARGTDVSIDGSWVYGTFTHGDIPLILAEPTVLGAHYQGGIIISAPPPGTPPAPVPTLHPIALSTLAGALVLVAYLSLWRRL